MNGVKLLIATLATVGVVAFLSWVVVDGQIPIFQP